MLLLAPPPPAPPQPPPIVVVDSDDTVIDRSCELVIKGVIFDENGDGNSNPESHGCLHPLLAFVSNGVPGRFHLPGFPGVCAALRNRSRPPGSVTLTPFAFGEPSLD